MGNYRHIGDRLREERERLGINQSAFAAHAGMTRKTLFGYESGERAPDAGALSSWADLGIDVLYVVVGERSGTPASLSPDERELLELYREAPLAGKAVAVGALQGAIAPTKSSKFSVQAERVDQVVQGKVTQRGMTINVGKKKK